jgi:O-antigen/teichoic acid export membrane protein
LFVALSLGNASNYIFHVVVSRTLGPQDYGALGSVLAVMIVLGVPLAGVQAMLARRVAQLHLRSEQRIGEVWRQAWSAIGWVALAASALLATASPLVMRFLHLESAVTGLLLALYVVPAILAPIPRGVLQGSMRFKALALVTVAPIAVRLALGIWLVRVGAGVNGAVLASVVAEALGVALGVALLPGRRRLWPRWDPRAARHLLAEVGPVAAAMGALWLLVELDLILARHFLPAAAAGSYAAAGLLARAVLFVSGAVSLIALPHFSEHESRGKEAYRWLLGASAVVLGLGGVAALILAFFNDIIVSLTFGGRFAAAANLLPLMALALVGLGVANVLVYFFIAARSRVYDLLWGAIILESVAVTLNHGSPRAIVVISLLTAWGTVAIGLVISRGSALSISPLSRLPQDLHTSRTGSNDPASAPELSLIVPSHNGGSSLIEVVRALVSNLDGLHRSYEVIVVSDGSTQRFDDDLLRLHGPITVVHYERRQGKGVALRVGLVKARGRFVAFIDGDGDLDSVALKGFLAVMDLYDPDMVIGSKRHPLSIVSYPWTRRVMSWTYQRLVRLLFGLDVRDTQTGMKLIRRDVLDAVLPLMLEKRYAFDLEFLVVARKLGYRHLFEAPIRLDYKFRSTMSSRAVIGILRDTLAIFYRRYVLSSYDKPADRAVTAPEGITDPTYDGATPEAGIRAVT